MKINYLFILFFSLSLGVQGQTVLTIQGAATGTPTLFINNGAYLNVSGGISVQQAGSPAGAANDYLQNNGNIIITTDTTPGQGNFSNNVNGLNTYTSGQTTGTVVFAGSNITQSVNGGGSAQFMNLSTNSSSSPTLDIHQNVVVNGTFTIGGATAIIDSSTLTLNGTLTSSGTVTGSSVSNLVINGSGNLGSDLTFAAGGQLLWNLALNRANVAGHTVLLGTGLTVLDTLAITNGIFKLQGNNLVLPSSGLLTGSPYSAANMIQADAAGQFIRGVNSGPGSFVFPIGNGAPAYSPVTLNFISSASAGNVGVNVKPNAHPQINNPSAAIDYLTRYWTFSDTGITTYSYTGNFQYLNSDIVGADSAIKLNRWANPWQGYAGSSVAIADTLTITNALNQAQAPLAGDYTGRNVLCTASAGAVSASSDTTCQGNSESLSTVGSLGNVKWQSSSTPNNFIDITGADSVSYNTNPLAQTTYFRTYVSANTCVDTSAPVQIFVNPQPPVPLLSRSDSIICSTDSSQICVSNASNAFSSYNWNTGASTSCIIANRAQDYWVTVTGVSGCANISAHTSLAVYPVTSVSIIKEGDTLSTKGGIGYQWYLNNSAIQGANLFYYVVKQDGDYSVQLTDSNSCTANSSTFNINLGIAEISVNAAINIYPNPVSSGLLELVVNQEWMGSAYNIFDVSGRLVSTDLIRNEKTGIDVSILSPGFYTICLKQGNGFMAAVKFVKE